MKNVAFNIINEEIGDSKSFLMYEIVIKNLMDWGLSLQFRQK